MLKVHENSINTFIEYGAGRAGLSSYVAQSYSSEHKEKVEFMIIDRDTRRNKLDKNFREDFTTIREKMDIADFNLEAYLQVNKKDNRRMISIAKHLCGGATDLSLVSIEKGNCNL